jgi:hypothetical protein
MLQQQMTMNIINEIKIENRIKEAPSKFSMKLARAKKEFSASKVVCTFHITCASSVRNA